MTDFISGAGAQVKEMVLSALGHAIGCGELPMEPIPAFQVQIPADRAHGDFAANAAMVSAKAFRTAPRNVAEIILKHLVFDGTGFCRAEVAGPGFLNFFLSDRWYAGVLEAVSEQGESYGRSDYGKGKKVMVEYVSANPTGPMHLGNARGGVLGDCLSAALEACGHSVTREFYVNDAGSQIEKFADSLEARYLQIFRGEDAVQFPEDGYHGEYIKDYAKIFADKNGDRYLECEPAERRGALVDFALPISVEKMRSDLAKYRVEYDNWFYESALHEGGDIDRMIALLTERGLTYRADGALWYKATALGGEKDEVLVRGTGYPTYFAVDIAYHYNKFVVRGFDKVIDVWGADHHFHVSRMKLAMQAIGLEPGRLDIVLNQMVRLMRDGEVVKMSKRTGNSITLSDLLDEVPADAARFYFNLREPGTHLDFDLGLAVEQSSQNPVYYVQYAHARICSIGKNLAAQGVTERECTTDELCLLTQPEERDLIFLLAKLPLEIIEAARLYDSARLTKYAIETATLFHKFYNSCRVKCDDEPLMQARISLCGAVRTVLRNLLTMMKIDFPEVM